MNPADPDPRAAARAEATEAAEAGGGPTAVPAQQPLQGLRVVEFTHMVMGPTCGLVLADLGAEVLKVEPVGGDRTRHLLGAGAGFFPLFNRNKHSIGLDLDHPEGRAIAQQLALGADVVVENFKPGAMQARGLDAESLRARNPRLIHVALKGFLEGPYAHRPALDEVVQMMGGLAYMTGRPGDPLRAGSSVNDIMGGLFGAIGVLAALIRRGITGQGMAVTSALFENNVFLVAQHMLQGAITGEPAQPMPARVSAWGVYDVFQVSDGAIFLAAVSDGQWDSFCGVLGLEDLRHDPAWRSNNERVRGRERLLPLLRGRLAQRRVDELADLMERAGLPYAHIRRPEELFDDPHLRASGGLAPITLPDGPKAGQQVDTALLPITLDGERAGIRCSPPQRGDATVRVLQQLGHDAAAIESLRQRGVVG